MAALNLFGSILTTMIIRLFMIAKSWWNINWNFKTRRSQNLEAIEQVKFQILICSAPRNVEFGNQNKRHQCYQMTDNADLTFFKESPHYYKTNRFLGI